MTLMRLNLVTGGLIALACVLGIGAVSMAFGWVYGRGEQAGRAACVAEYTERDRAEQVAYLRELDEALIENTQASSSLAAQRRVLASERQAWKERRDATRSEDLVQPAPPGPGGDGASAPAGADRRLSAAFLGLYNDAWCLSAGDAVSTAACRSAAAAAGPGAVEPGRVVDHVEREAARCAEDRQQLARLIERLSRHPYSGPAVAPDAAARTHPP